MYIPDDSYNLGAGSSGDECPTLEKTAPRRQKHGDR